ncbi:acyl carrier protein [Chitinophaga nivalis]|uniref:Acyl carrier protein n=1 Tax=Chitinophaga nivalis TaxID=2991709 RepID=A0ABT3IMR5_9BACT|nr:acyl carrier protein [Chitinophaga nivalis]MCW3465039.1 acyl carrier protein [Chitinophaga nivalis]MCW3485269.1 acyl carrier protein [Chitinophaga nivalis]
MDILQKKSATDIQSFIKEKIGTALEIPVDNMDIDQDIETFGLDSIMVVHITADLSTWAGQSLDPSLFYKHNTIRSSSGYIASIINQ